MRKQGKITIFEKEYPYKFSMKAMRFFMEKHGLKTFEQYQEKLIEMEPKENEQLTFNGLYILADLVITAIQAADPGVELNFDADDFLDETSQSPEKIQQLLKAFIESQPEETPADTVGKQQGAEVV